MLQHITNTSNTCNWLEYVMWSTVRDYVYHTLIVATSAIQFQIIDLKYQILIFSVRFGS